MKIVDEKYVSLTTHRKNGDAVATPVWIAPLGDGSAGFTTGSDSGKVKRIRNNPVVTIRPCTMRGTIKTPGGPTPAELTATAHIVDGVEFKQVRSAIKAKYGIPAKLIGFFSSLGAKIRRKQTADCGIVLRFDA